MIGLYFIDDTQTYTFRAKVYGITEKSTTLGDLEILWDGEFAPFKDGDDNKYLYYMCNNDLCKDIDTGMYIEFTAEIGQMKLHEEDIFPFDNCNIDDYIKWYGEDILSEYSVIENIINDVMRFQTDCMHNREALYLHILLSDVYREGVIRVFTNPTEVKILGTSEIEELETHALKKRLFFVQA